MIINFVSNRSTHYKNGISLQEPTPSSLYNHKSNFWHNSKTRTNTPRGTLKQNNYEANHYDSCKQLSLQYHFFFLFSLKHTSHFFLFSKKNLISSFLLRFFFVFLPRCELLRPGGLGCWGRDAGADHAGRLGGARRQPGGEDGEVSRGVRGLQPGAFGRRVFWLWEKRWFVVWWLCGGFGVFLFGSGWVDVAWREEDRREWRGIEEGRGSKRLQGWLEGWITQ